MNPKPQHAGSRARVIAPEPYGDPLCLSFCITITTIKPMTDDNNKTAAVLAKAEDITINKIRIVMLIIIK